jgi:hypothetical protein
MSLLEGIFSSNFEASGTDYGLANFTNDEEMEAASGWLIQVHALFLHIFLAQTCYSSGKKILIYMYEQ